MSTAVMQRLVRELNRFLFAHEHPPVRFEELGFVHDSFVDYGERPSVPAGRIRTGTNALELLASLAERNPAWIHANFIVTHAGHRIVALRAGEGAGGEPHPERASINLSIEPRAFDLTDDEARPITYGETGAADAGAVLGTLEELQAGERVVDLGALCVTCGTVSGALTAALGVAWTLDRALSFAGAALIAGGILGLVAGKIAGRAFRTGGGFASVVRAGRTSLGSTLRAGLTGGFAGAVLAVVAVAVGFGAIGQALPLIGLGLGIAIVVGTAFGYLSALV